MEQRTHIPFEKEIALSVLRPMSDCAFGYPGVFELLKLPYPTSRDGVLEKLQAEQLIERHAKFSITTLGGILLPKI